MNARKILTPTLLAALLAGCAVGPDYRRPEAALPEAFTEAPATPAVAPTANLLQKEWWTLFQDETLNQLVEKALASNHDLLAAVARVEEAEAVLREAGATQWPQINAEAGASRTQASLANAIPVPSSTPRLRDARRAALTTSFEIDLWGRLRRATEAARAQALSSQYARDTVELSVAGLVTANYLALRAYDAELAVSRDSLQSREASLRIARNRFDGGLTSPLDVHQAEGALAAAEAQLAGLRQQRALTQNQLALLTGQPGLAIAPGDLRQLPLPPVPPAGLPSTLLEARPDLRQAEENLVAANAKIGVAKAAYFPTLSLTGSLGSESAALANLFTAAAGAWSLGLGAVMPLLDFGRTGARVDQASAQQRQAVANYQKAVQTAFREVMDALVKLRETADGEQAQAARVVATKKALHIAELRYESGYSAYLEVLDAQRSANDALISHIDTRQTRLSAAVDLFKSLGGGWQDNAPRPPATN
jgi:multidrug efflux system outer membrane protein